MVNFLAPRSRSKKLRKTIANSDFPETTYIADSQTHINNKISLNKLFLQFDTKATLHSCREYRQIPCYAKTSVPDPEHFGTDPDLHRQTNPDSAPDPALFVSDLQDTNKKLFFLLITF